VRASVIVPFHRNAEHLGACLAALRRSGPGLELIVVADGAVDDCLPAARAFDATVLTIPGPAGPAVARNRGASIARAAILVFVDADVVVAPDAVGGMCDLLDAEPAVSGVFGAYDHRPPAENFASQFKNLSHAYVHEVGNRTATTFWAGLGAVRSGAFQAVAGFDERFRRPSVEDIDLGYRLIAAGYVLRLEPRFRGTHLKRWTVWSCVVTDVRARGIPWTQLILRSGAISNDLNTSRSLRISVALAYGVLAALGLLAVTPWAGAAALVMLGGLVALNIGYYRWFARARGWRFALRVLPMHFVHHLCNGVSFLAGSLLHAARSAGIRLPGAIPRLEWPAGPRMVLEPRPPFRV
jgi:glycosyltransferase involved in cell wall biosynthesis